MKKTVIFGMVGLVIVVSIGLAAVLSVEDYRRAAAMNNLEELNIKEICPTVYAFRSLDGDVIEIGSERHSPPQPYLKVSRWDGEVYLKVDVPYVKQEVPEYIDNRLKWSNDAYEVDFYPKEPEEITAVIAGKEFTFTINEEGGVEFDLVLKEKPDSNVFSFPIEAKGLKFYYLPALHSEHPTWADTDGDGKADSFRPENVVGSYAVYHETQDKMWKTEAEAEKYQTGKAFHIYRPKVYDAEGNEIWGELRIDEEKGVLTVTVDRDWLDKAVYPVTIDPIFGYDGETETGDSVNYIRGSNFTTTAAGTATKISAYLECGAAGKAKAAIYEHSDSSLRVVAESQEIATPGTGWHWLHFPISASLTADTEYILVARSNVYVNLGFTDIGAGMDQRYIIYNIDGDNPPYGTFPDPATFTLRSGNYIHTIYCTYTQLAVLNEVCYSPSEGNDWFELYNPHDSPIDINGWTFENDTGGTIEEYGTEHTIDAGCWDVVDVGDQLGDTDSIRAYDGGTLVDFVAWGADSSGDTEAVAARIWSVVGDFVNHDGKNSIYLLQDGADNDQPSDWGARDDPTPSAPVPDVSALLLFASGLILVVAYLVHGRRRKGEMN